MHYFVIVLQQIKWMQNRLKTPLYRRMIPFKAYGSRKAAAMLDSQRMLSPIQVITVYKHSVFIGIE